MKLTSTNVNAAFMACLFQEGENTDDHVVGSGVLTNVGFHPARLEAHRDVVVAMIQQLDSTFINNGMSMLKMCHTSGGEQWGEHRNADQLICLGAALGIMEFPIDREMWKMLPGGLPYVNFKI